MPYSYTVYSMDVDSEPAVQTRSDTFSLHELQQLVGGRIEIVPSFDDTMAFVVCEDGMYRFGINPHCPDFCGCVVLVDVRLLRM